MDLVRGGRRYKTRQLVHVCKREHRHGPLMYQAQPYLKMTVSELAKQPQGFDALNAWVAEWERAETLFAKATELLSAVAPSDWPVNAEAALLAKDLTEVQAYPTHTPSQPLQERRSSLLCSAQAPPAPPTRELPGSKSCWALMRKS